MTALTVQLAALLEEYGFVNQQPRVDADRAAQIKAEIERVTALIEPKPAAPTPETAEAPKAENTAAPKPQTKQTRRGN